MCRTITLFCDGQSLLAEKTGLFGAKHRLTILVNCDLVDHIYYVQNSNSQPRSWQARDTVVRLLRLISHRGPGVDLCLTMEEANDHVASCVKKNTYVLDLFSNVTRPMRTYLLFCEGFFLLILFLFVFKIFCYFTCNQQLFSHLIDSYKLCNAISLKLIHFTFLFQH